MAKLTIPGSFPNLNEIIKASKAHYRRYSGLKKQYTQIVVCETKAQRVPKMGRIDAVFTWYCKDKRQDKDNIMTGQKFIFDGLVKAGVLENDGWKHIGDITHRFEVDKEHPRVEVELIEKVIA